MLQLPRNWTHCTSLSFKTSSCGLGKLAGGAVVKKNCPAENVIILTVRIEGRRGTALLDSGCSCSLVKSNVIRRSIIRDDQDSPLITMSSQHLRTEGTIEIASLCHGTRELGPTKARVVEKLPFDVDFIIGLPIILKHGLWIGSNHGQRTVKWGGAMTCGEVNSSEIDDHDFNAKFCNNIWTVKWKWRSEPGSDLRPINYKISERDEKQFDDEIKSWIAEGILVEHSQKIHGAIKRFVPMMGIRQIKGDASKVRPVLDLRKLNQTISSHPGGATPLCASRLREWCQLSDKCSLLDLRKAYLQIHINREQWTHQIIIR